MLSTHLEQLGKLTPSERKLWVYLQANLETLAFENGATLAQKSGVSPNTVSRFLRRLGYKGLKSLKEELRDAVRVQSLLNGTLIERLQQPDDLIAHLNEEIEALREFAECLGSAHWQDIVSRVSRAERVFVCGFQTIRGLAEDFANRLALVREFTDEYGIARHIHTPHILCMKTKTGLILESTGGLTCALNVLLHCVASAHKSHLKNRLAAYRERVQRLRLYRT